MYFKVRKEKEATFNKKKNYLVELCGCETEES